jgi:hypothetical protein
VRQLHVVAITSDGKSLLLAGAPKGAKATHRVAVDKRLQAALAGELYAAPADGEVERQESALTVREMQARLRAGQSVEDVARAAGIPGDRVERYFAPVESERIQVIEAAQAAVVDRPRWGPSARTLGDSVVANLAVVSGLKPESVGWTTRRRQDGCWIVRLEFIARGRRRVAEWEWEPHERTATALNHLATTIGHIEPRQRARARATASRSRAAARRPTRRKATARKATTKKAAARKATRKAATRKTTARKTATRKATSARKTAARKTASRKTAARKSASRASAARTSAKRSTGGRRTTRRR